MQTFNEQAPPGGQEWWTTLLEHVQEIVILLAPDGVITYTSPSTGRWLGYSSEELVGENLTALIHPEDRALLAAVSGGCVPGRLVSVDHRLRSKDGVWRRFESTVVCLRHEPLVGALLITASDVTERVALEKERERLEMDRRVSQRLEAVGQLAAGIAHEINTPLQFVGDSVTFLREAVAELLSLTTLYRETLHSASPTPVEERRLLMRAAEEEADVEYLCERIPKAFERTSDGIERVRSIVLAMKRFSHSSSDEMALADVNEALETTLAVCRNEYKYVATVVTELGELPLVQCNISELNQVFLNLIINAAQAIQEQVSGSGRQGQIRIATWSESDEVVIEIADDGPGIPTDLQDRIYEPFFTTKEVGRGTGQGLAIARAAVEHHSGSLECRSEIGAGTVFSIRLPVGSGGDCASSARASLTASPASRHDADAVPEART